jgi:hypothetical protein
MNSTEYLVGLNSSPSIYQCHRRKLIDMTFNIMDQLSGFYFSMELLAARLEATAVTRIACISVAPGQRFPKGRAMSYISTSRYVAYPLGHERVPDATESPSLWVHVIRRITVTSSVCHGQFPHLGFSQVLL